jgi:lipopolysaccharide transport system permease protein/teichoic acid transport system permease protein
MATTEQTGTLRVPPRARPGSLALVRDGLVEIWSRRRLARYLVQAELTAKGADTLLGNIWWVLDPLLQMAVYVVLVTVISGKTTADYPLFIFSAILPWKWFASTVNDATTSVVSREKIIKQVHFPKIVLPFAASLSGIVNFGFGLVALAGLLFLFYAHRASPTLLFIPVIAAVQFVFTLAVAIVVSGVNVFYRDVGNVMRHILRLWFYLSPGLYSAKQLAQIADQHPTVSAALGFNPFTVLFESYRGAIYDGVAPSLSALGVLLGVSLILLAIAILLFKRVEPAFAKVL